MLSCACLLALCIGAAPAARKSPAKHPEIEKAIAHLKREYAAHARDPSRVALRTECDYFAAATTSIPTDGLLLALEKPLGSDGRMTAYVKWQLLSALPQTLDEDCIARLAKVYQRAPVPALRYGCSPQEQRLLDKLIPAARPQDDVQLTAHLQKAVDRATQADFPIIAVRDELYRRLPPGRPKFVAALHDAHVRLSVAAQKEKLTEALLEDLPKWAGVPSTDQGEIREVAELFGKLRFVESPPYYESAGMRRGKLTWVTDTDTLLTKKKSETLHKLLLEAAGVPPISSPDPASAGRQQPQPQQTNSKSKKAGNNS